MAVILISVRKRGHPRICLSDLSSVTLGQGFRHSDTPVFWQCSAIAAPVPARHKTLSRGTVPGMETPQEKPTARPRPLIPPLDYARHNAPHLDGHFERGPGEYPLIDICRTLLAGDVLALATAEYVGAHLTTATSAHNLDLATTTVTMPTPDTMAAVEQNILAALADGPKTARQIQRTCRHRALRSVAGLAGYLDRLEAAGKVTSTRLPDRPGRPSTVWAAAPGVDLPPARPRSPERRLRQAERDMLAAAQALQRQLAGFQGALAQIQAASTQLQQLLDQPPTPADTDVRQE
jgi:hypothetical protein